MWEQRKKHLTSKERSIVVIVQELIYVKVNFRRQSLNFKEKSESTKKNYGSWEYRKSHFNTRHFLPHTSLRFFKIMNGLHKLVSIVVSFLHGKYTSVSHSSRFQLGQRETCLILFHETTKSFINSTIYSFP